jgi:hypothetical protein
MRIAQSHPYWTIKKLVERGEIAQLNFSYYRYRPQSLLDERNNFSLSAENLLDENYISELIENCPEEFELAIHSNVVMANGGMCHIPMIDMSTASKAHINRLSSFLGTELFEHFSWYESGRSFHGYGEITVNQSEWTQLMGILLLANQKNLAPTVDPRWIGHRLIAGYSALRWTKNTQFYINSPRALIG